MVIEEYNNLNVYDRIILEDGEYGITAFNRGQGLLELGKVQFNEFKGNSVVYGEKSWYRYENVDIVIESKPGDISKIYHYFFG